MHRRPYGPSAWLVEELDDPAAWADGLRALDLLGVVDVVPAESTVLVVTEPTATATIGARLDDVVPVASPGGPEAEVVIDVVYDGADLAEVAAKTGLSTDEVVLRHASTAYTVAFCGFSPGFAYLRGVDPALRLPRRDVPRTRVPAGAVAIAAGYTAVYPSSSPGGWHVLGTTSMTLWDPAFDPPAILRPGRAVRFRPT